MRILFLLAVIVSACSPKPVTVEERIEFPEIQFMSGGGFTGMYTTYIYDKEGKILVQEEGERMQIGELTDAEEKTIYIEINELMNKEEPINVPGNMTYSVTVKDKTINYSWVWGDSKFPPPVKVQEFFDKYYTKAQSLIK